MATRYSFDGNSIVWQGFINDMELIQPGMSMRRSLDEMYNQEAVRYTPIDTTTNPPTESAETSTAVVNDTDSQNRYGIKQTVFQPPSMNRLTAGDASQLANTILGQYKQPRRSATISSGSDNPRLVVNCKGFMWTLDWRIYNQTANSSTDNASTILAAVITAVGSQIAAATNITTNNTAVQKYFNRDDTAFNVIQWIASLGDASYNRWVANVLENRIINYQQAATTITYFRRLVDNRQDIFDYQNRRVPYWEIRPDSWVRTSDVYPHNITPGNLIDDVQSVYIESVDFREPDSLTLNGSTGDKLQVILARQANRGDALL